MSNKKPEVSIIHSHLLLNTGGSRFIFEVAKRLKKKYSVTVFCECVSNEWKQEFALQRIPVVSLLPITSTSLVYWLFFPFFFLLDAYNLHKKLPKDSLVLTYMFPMHAALALIGRSYLCYCFEPFAFFYDPSLLASFPKYKRAVLKVLSFLYAPLDAWGVASSRKLLAINPSVGRWIKKIYSRSPDVYTYLGVDTKKFHPQVRIPQAEVILMHSTDYTPLKGTQLLLEALPSVQSRNWKLYISESVTNVHAQEKCKEYLRDQGLEKNVTFLGHVPFDKLSDLYANADIYCFTGDPRSTGATAASLSVLEAAASGLPVIRSCGNTDEVLSGVTGLVVNPLKREQLAKAIDLLVQSNVLRIKFSRAARRHILSRYTWEAVTSSVEVAFKEHSHGSEKKSKND